jgi:hypothetical protein
MKTRKYRPTPLTSGSDGSIKHCKLVFEPLMRHTVWCSASSLPVELSTTEIHHFGMVLHSVTRRITNYTIPTSAHGLSDTSRRHRLPQRMMFANVNLMVPGSAATDLDPGKHNKSPTPRNPTSPQCAPRTFRHKRKGLTPCIPNTPVSAASRLRPKKFVVSQAHDNVPDPSDTATARIISVASLYLGIQYQSSDLS